jgi:hypothetical protein
MFSATYKGAFVLATLGFAHGSAAEAAGRVLRRCEAAGPNNNHPAEAPSS